jgi:hypothetical protein
MIQSVQLPKHKQICNERGYRVEPMQGIVAG